VLAHCCASLLFKRTCRCVLTPNVPEFNRLIESAKRHYSEKVLLRSSTSLKESSSAECSAALLSGGLEDGEEHSLVDMEKILLGLNSSTEEEKTKYLSIAMGGVTVLRKG
jgi:hypothetical protein